MDERIFFYVLHHEAEAFQTLGWQYSASLEYPHAAYSSLYEWPLVLGEPKLPAHRIARLSKAMEGR